MAAPSASQLPALHSPMPGTQPGSRRVVLPAKTRRAFVTGLLVPSIWLTCATRTATSSAPCIACKDSIAEERHLVGAGEQLLANAPEFGTLVEKAVPIMDAFRQPEQKLLALRGQHGFVRVEVHRE